MGVNLNVVFHRHGDEPYNLSTKTINCTNMCYAVHHQFLILVGQDSSSLLLLYYEHGDRWDSISEGFTHPLLADIKAL